MLAPTGSRTRTVPSHLKEQHTVSCVDERRGGVDEDVWVQGGEISSNYVMVS